MMVKTAILILGLACLVTTFTQVAWDSRPKSELTEARSLALAAPQADTATSNALEATWARVKESGFDVKAEKLSAKEFAGKNFPLQTMLLIDGDAQGADVNALYLGAEKLDEGGVPSEIFYYEQAGLRRSWFDTRYSPSSATVSSDGIQVIVKSHSTIGGELLWYLMIAVATVVSAIIWLIVALSVANAAVAISENLGAFVYRLRS